MFLFYLSFILFNIIQINSTLNSCRQTFGSNKYDLNQLSRFTLEGEELLFRYVFTPCGLVPTDKCGQFAGTFEKGMTACQERMKQGTFESAMGFLDGYDKLPNLEFSENPQGPGTGVIMIMRNAKCNGGPRIVKVTFICDKTIDQPTKMDVIEIPSCNFTIAIKASGACPVTGGGGGTDGGMPGGAIFIIILVVLIVVYIFGGILYNKYQRNEKGLALLPHPTFWLLFVGLFVSGCRSTFNFVRTCGHGTSNAYQSV